MSSILRNQRVVAISDTSLTCEDLLASLRLLIYKTEIDRALESSKMAFLKWFFISWKLYSRHIG